ncbi:hypothetical protein AAMO2058_001480800 [Amorphochlora amoebiformis]
MNANTRHNISLFLLGATVIFGIVAYVGAQGDIGWSTLDATYEVNFGSTTTRTQYVFDYGLLGFKGFIESSPGTRDSTNGQYDDDDKCSADYCHKCHDAGASTVTMLTIGLVASIIAVAVVLMRKNDAQSNSDNSCSKKFLAMAACGTMGVASLASWTTWAGGCHEEIVSYFKNVNDTFDLGDYVQLGAGFALAVLAMAFSIAAGVNEGKNVKTHLLPIKKSPNNSNQKPCHLATPGLRIKVQGTHIRGAHRPPSPATP